MTDQNGIAYDGIRVIVVESLGRLGCDNSASLIRLLLKLVQIEMDPATHCDSSRSYLLPLYSMLQPLTVWPFLDFPPRAWSLSMNGRHEGSISPIWSVRELVLVVSETELTLFFDGVRLRPTVNLCHGPPAVA